MLPDDAAPPARRAINQSITRELNDLLDLNITDGILRARYRDSRERAALMVPGEAYGVTIEPFPTDPPMSERFPGQLRQKTASGPFTYPRGARTSPT